MCVYICMYVCVCVYVYIYVRKFFYMHTPTDRIAGPHFPIGVVGHWPRAHGCLGAH